MAAGVIFAEKRKSPGVLDLLSSAVCEWLLILLLFMDASLKYLAEKLAQHCELNAPCMLCSRLDHVLGKPVCYWNLLCGHHREEISSFVSCSVHCNLVDSHGMREDCLIKSSGSSSNIGCAQLNTSLDPESKAPQSEDDDGGNHCWGRKYGSERENDVCFGRRSRPETRAGNAALGRLRYQRFEVMQSVLNQPKLLDFNDPKNAIYSSREKKIEHGLRNLDLGESYPGPSSCFRADIVTLDYETKLDNGVAETSKCNASCPDMPAISVLPEILSLSDVPSLSYTAPTVYQSNNVFQAKDKEYTCVPKYTEAASEGSFDNRSSCTNYMNRSNPLTQFHGIESKSASGQLEKDPIFLCDSVKIEEDVNSLEPISTVKLGLSLNNDEHKANYQDDESGEHKYWGFHLLPFSSSLVGNGSSYELLDNISVCCVEGESNVDRLKGQVEKYRRYVKILFSELEEERNAAAIAANQAMAMITRLQEQKAAFHMEALQYLRIMEEQAEYDIEELERANNLLAEKEKELQGLKSELELWRNSYLDESSIDSPHRELLKVSNHVIANVENSPCILNNSVSYISQSFKSLCQVEELMTCQTA